MEGGKWVDSASRRPFQLLICLSSYYMCKNRIVPRRTVMRVIYYDGELLLDKGLKFGRVLIDDAMR